MKVSKRALFSSDSGCLLGLTKKLTRLNLFIMVMSDAEIEMFCNAVAGARCYLEYGAGGSTKKVVRILSEASITSVESDADFVKYEVMSDAQVKKAVDEKRLDFKIVDIGPVKKWGYPADDSKSFLWPNYSLSPYIKGYNPDFVLIDGRFRVACGLIAALCAPQARVMVHDYSIRSEYSILEHFFKIECSVDTLVQMRRKSEIDKVYAKKLLSYYMYTPGDEPPTLSRKANGLYQQLKRNAKALIFKQG